MPLPVSVTVCGLLGALSVKVRVALRGPVAFGMNATVTVHVPWDAIRWPLQPSERTGKSLGLLPPPVSLATVSTACAVFVIVMFCCAVV